MRMKPGFGGLALATAFCAAMSGQAAAQCAAGTQVQNGAFVGASFPVTFVASGFNIFGGSVTVANVTGTWPLFTFDVKSAASQANAFDNALAGTTPAGVAGITMSGTYSGFNAGVASGAVVNYTSTTQSLCSAVTFPTPTATGSGNAPTVGTCVNGSAANALTTLMNLSLVCGRPGAAYPGSANDRWQEQHRAGSQLWDFKQGASTVDPTKQVGSWAVSGTGAASQVSHTYGSTTYNWTVHNNGTHFSFCTGVGGAEHVRAFITTPGTLATASCGSYPP